MTDEDSLSPHKLFRGLSSYNRCRPGLYGSQNADEKEKGLSAVVYFQKSDYEHTLLIASRRFFLVWALTYVPMTKPTKLKNGTQVCSGRNFCAKARAIGDVIQLTFITGMKPALTVARTWWKVFAPAIRAMKIR
jgi:hypothetical protein